MKITSPTPGPPGQSWDPLLEGGGRPAVSAQGPTRSPTVGTGRRGWGSGGPGLAPGADPGAAPAQGCGRRRQRPQGCWRRTSFCRRS